HIVATRGVHAHRRNFNQATQPLLKPRPRLPDILIQSGKYTHHITTGDGKTAGGAKPGAPMRPKPPVAIERVTPHGRPDAARGVQPGLRGLDGETPNCAGLCGGRTRSKSNGCQVGPGCSATGPALTSLFSFRRGFRYHARMVARTLAIIKPDAVRRHLVGAIIQRYEQAGLIPVAIKMVRLTKAQAEAFYYVHKQRPFFDSLCSFMSSGPIVVLALEGENAIERHRDLMGATDPAKAAAGTIRK